MAYGFGLRDPTPFTLPSNPDELATLKAELQEKLLQIEELEGRARQDSNLRPSDLSSPGMANKGRWQVE